MRVAITGKPWRFDGPRPPSRRAIISEMDAVLRRLVRTQCGRDQLADLRARHGAWAALRLAWFVAVAAIRDIGKPANP